VTIPWVPITTGLVMKLILSQRMCQIYIAGKGARANSDVCMKKVRMRAEWTNGRKEHVGCARGGLVDIELVRAPTRPASTSAGLTATPFKSSRRRLPLSIVVGALFSMCMLKNRVII